MSLDVCISPIKTTIGAMEDYSSEAQYRCELEVIENLITTIQKRIKEQIGKIKVWNEEELCPDHDELVQEDDLNVFCERIGSYSIIHNLRRYAAHIDINGKPPLERCELEESSKDDFLLQIYDGDVDTKFLHLIDHSDCDGYYIPCEFETPIWIEPAEIGMKDNEDILISVGSTNKLLKELEMLNEHLQIDVNVIDDLESFSEKILDDDLEYVKWAWAVLYYMCKASIEHRQPIIFC